MHKVAVVEKEKKRDSKMSSDWVQVEEKHSPEKPESMLTLLQHLVWCSERPKVTVHHSTVVAACAQVARLAAFQVRQPPLPKKKATLNAAAIEDFVCRLFRSPRTSDDPDRVEQLRRDAVMPAFRDAGPDICFAPTGAVFHVDCQSTVEVGGLVWLKTHRVTSCQRPYHAWILACALVPWTDPDDCLVRVAVPFIETSGVVWEYLERTVIP